MIFIFTTVEQVKQIIKNYIGNEGSGGFVTGVVTSISPLIIKMNKLELTEDDLYITDNCIGISLRCKCKDNITISNKAILRSPFKVGDGVLIMVRPNSLGKNKYIIIDKIQSYLNVREVMLDYTVK